MNNYSSRGASYGSGARRPASTSSRPSNAPRRPTDLNETNLFDRFLSDIGDIATGLPGALAEMVGAVGSDTIMRPLRALTPGGSTGFDYGSQTWDSVIKPVGESLWDTVQLGGQVLDPRSYFTQDGRDGLRERGQEFSDNPGIFLLEHIGNAAIVGSTVSQPLKAGARHAAGAPKASKAQGLSGTAGRQANRQQIADIAASGGDGARIAQAAQISGDLVGRPYRATGRAVLDAKLPNFGFLTDAQSVADHGYIGRFTNAPANHSLREVIQQVRESPTLDRMPVTPAMREAAEMRRLNAEVEGAQASGDPLRLQQATEALDGFRAGRTPEQLAQLEQTRLAPTPVEELSSPLARGIRERLNSPTLQPLTAPISGAARSTRRMVTELRDRRTDAAWETHVDHDPVARRSLAERQLRDLGRAEGVDLESYGIALPSAVRNLDPRAGGGDRFQAIPDADLLGILEKVRDTPELRQQLPRLDEILDRTIIDLYENVSGLESGTIRNQLYHDTTLTPEVADTVRHVQRLNDDAPDAVRGAVDDALGQAYRMDETQLANPVRGENSPHARVRASYDAELERIKRQATTRDVTLAERNLGNPDAWALRVTDEDGALRPMRPDENPTLSATPSKAQARTLKSAGRKVGAARRLVEDLQARNLDRGAEPRSTASTDYRRANREVVAAQRGLDRAERAGDQQLAEQLGRDLTAAQERAAASRAASREDVLTQTQADQRALEGAVRELGQADLPVGATQELTGAVAGVLDDLNAAFGRAGMEPPPQLARSIDDLRDASVDIAATDLNALDNLQRLAEASPDDLATWREAIEGGANAVKNSKQARRNVSNVERIIRAEERAKSEMQKVRQIQRRLDNTEGRLDARDPAILRAAEAALRDAELDAQRIATEAGVTQATPSTPAAQRKLEDRLLREQDRATKELAELKRAERSLERVEAKFASVEADLMSSLDAAPAVARPVLQVGRAMSELDKVMRESGLGHVADDLNLNGLPTTLEQMNAAGVSPVFLRRIEDRLAAQGYRSASEQPVKTSTMSAQKRREMSDIDITDDIDRVQMQADIELAGRVLAGDMVETFKTKFARSADDIAEALIERGTLSREAWRDMGQAGRERTLQQAGYNAYDPGSIFSFKVRNTSSDAQWVPSHLNTALNEYLKQGTLEKVITRIVQPATTTWKHAVLALRPAWHVYNTVGNAAMSILAGKVPAVEFMRQWAPQSDARRLLRAHRTGRGLDEFNLTPDTANDLFGNSLTRDLAPGQRTRETLSEAMTNPEALQGAMNQRGVARPKPAPLRNLERLTGASYRANQFSDNLGRAAVYLHDTLRMGSDPQTAIAHANRTLGDYTSLNHVERTYLRTVFPFYTWMRHITRLSSDMLRPDNITRAMTLGTVVQTLGTDRDGMDGLLPGYMAGDLRIPGTDIYVGMRGFNPWQDVLDTVVYNGEFSTRGIARSMHPGAQFYQERNTGIDTLTGRPFSRPVPVLDDLGREIPTAPGFAEHAFQKFAPPQAHLARNLFRKATGQTTARYSTGDPVLVEGAREPNMWAGVGGFFGAPLRFPDVEGIEERRANAIDRAERQIERYAEELERVQQQQGSRTLPERLNPLNSPRSLPQRLVPGS